MKWHPHLERPDRLRAIAASLATVGVLVNFVSFIFVCVCRSWFVATHINNYFLFQYKIFITVYWGYVVNHMASFVPQTIDKQYQILNFCRYISGTMCSNFCKRNHTKRTTYGKQWASSWGLQGLIKIHAYNSTSILLLIIKQCFYSILLLISETVLRK